MDRILFNNHLISRCDAWGFQDVLAVVAGNPDLRIVRLTPTKKRKRNKKVKQKKTQY